MDIDVEDPHLMKMHLIMMDKRTSPLRLVVPPGVVHAYACTAIHNTYGAIGVQEGLVLNLPDRLYRGFKKEEKPDEIRHEGNPDYGIEGMGG
jgi:hypothetical protein